MKSTKPLTKEELEAKKRDRARAKACKAVVFPLEKKNDKFLYVFPSTDGWYKMGGRSALFFKHLVAPRLKIKCKLQTDRDYYYNFKDGIVPVKDLNKMEQRLKELRIYKKGVEKEYIAFEMQGRVSEGQVKELRQIEKNLLREINKIIDPAEVLTRSLAMARTVQKDVFETCRKIDKPTRELIGRDTVYVALRIMDNILHVCQGKKKLEGLEKSVGDDASLLMSRVTLMIDEKRIDTSAGVRVMQHIQTLEDTLRDEVRGLKQKKEKQNE